MLKELDLQTKPKLKNKMSKISNLEALKFYFDNDLVEVFANKSQNHFAQSEKQKLISILPERNLEKKQENFIEKTPLKNAPNFFNNPVKSSFEAISNLAQKSNKNMSENLQDFKSLNEIILSAKKLAKSAKTLAELKKAVENFDGCNLKKMATNTVFAQGSENSKVMVLGEAPGNHEDLSGVPFCGDSGKMLDEMLESINLKRSENCYISNVIFWRPPGNRTPSEEELAICRPFVERHIQLLNPKILVLVGSCAMSAVLGIKEPVTKVRGQFLDFAPDFLDKKIKAFTIFHPSYLMRQPMKKKLSWLDMLELEKFLNS